MSMIYDLDNEYGGRIIADADSSNAALELTSNATYVASLKLSRIKGNETMVLVHTKYDFGPLGHRAYFSTQNVITGYTEPYRQ